jgi:hypothetical protein
VSDLLAGSWRILEELYKGIKILKLRKIGGESFEEIAFFGAS